MSINQEISDLPILLVGGLVFVGMALAAVGGALLRNWHDQGDRAGGSGDGTEGYLISAVLGLLALLMGFSFSLAVDRFEIRRVLVLNEANAIGTAWLRTQLLDQPHRARISAILLDYTDNRLALAAATSDEAPPLIRANDAMVTDLWAATSAAFDSIEDTDFSSAYLESINELIDLDSARKAARLARVPAEVFGVLIIYLIATAAVLGYVLHGSRGRVAAGFTLALLATSYLLIVDIDRPTRGGVRESQRPVELLRQSLAAQSPEIFDRYRAEPSAATGTTQPGVRP